MHTALGNQICAAVEAGLEQLPVFIAYPSKRNAVFLTEVLLDASPVPVPVVVKRHSHAENAAAELQILLLLQAHGIRVPVPYGVCGRFLCMAPVAGTLLVDLLDRGAAQPVRWAKSLAAWLWRLHRMPAGAPPGHSFLKKDVNLRNFIYHRRLFTGLDFEEQEYGPPQKDVGRLGIHLLVSHPPFTAEKFRATELFIREYLRLHGSMVFRDIRLELNLAYQEMLERRRWGEDRLSRYPGYRKFKTMF